MVKKSTSLIIALFLVFINLSVSFAQDSSDNPIYIVQPGENLTEIADKFNISVQEIISINGIVNSNLISAGTKLIIPGLDGVTGLLKPYPVKIGESFQVLLRKNNLDLDNFLKLNKITSPSEIYVGTNLILPASEQDPENLFSSFFINRETSPFEQTIFHNQNRWYVNKNNENNISIAIPGDVFFYTSKNASGITYLFSPYIQSIEITPLPIIQGHTSVLKIRTSNPVNLSGKLNSKDLHFFLDSEDGFYYSLEGIHALQEPGLVPLNLQGIFDNGESFEIDQMVLLSSGGYVEESITVESTFIDKELNTQESSKIADLLKPISSDKLWDDSFQFPIVGSLNDQTISLTSYFGNRRSYNSGQYFGFHGGLDFKVVINSLDIYAPAPGIVIFAGPMDIRGFTTFIDHGQGVVSGYAHQSEILIETGEKVETGQIIGIIGNTGRVTGPHLHWDIWVNGNQVDPFDWIENTYP
jgi:murein DD-endopeptidase MepM/ murein hydrolase activator NlpD